MIQAAGKKEIVQQLQKEVLSLQGFMKASVKQRIDTGLGAIEKAFPGNTFPLGAIHEFTSMRAEDAAATNGFIAALLGKFMKQDKTCLWISKARTIYPPALGLFGIAAERIIFIDLARQKDVLWAVEEALRCDALAAVVGELTELSFTESRRLQLAVEQSQVSGFIHRCNPKSIHALACVSRWKIKPLQSLAIDKLPGPGFPRWQVQLLKVRNGRPGTWQLEWLAGSFRHPSLQVFATPHIHPGKSA